MHSSKRCAQRSTDPNSPRTPSFATNTQRVAHRDRATQERTQPHHVPSPGVTLDGGPRASLGPQRPDQPVDEALAEAQVTANGMLQTRHHTAATSPWSGARSRSTAGDRPSGDRRRRSANTTQVLGTSRSAPRHDRKTLDDSVPGGRTALHRRRSDTAHSTTARDLINPATGERVAPSSTAMTTTSTAVRSAADRRSSNLDRLESQDASRGAAAVGRPRARPPRRTRNARHHQHGTRSERGHRRRHRRATHDPLLGRIRRPNARRTDPRQYPDTCRTPSANHSE